MTRHFLLPPDQAARAIAAGGPLQAVDPAKLREMSIAVVEVDGQIVAYWVAWYGLHVEPIWIDPAHRRSPRVVGGIVAEMEQLVSASGEQSAFCVIEAEDQATVAPYVERLGFLPADGGQLYYLVEAGVLAQAEAEAAEMDARATARAQGLEA